MKFRYCLYLLPAAILVLTACESEQSGQEEATPPGDAAEASPQETWWTHMQSLCGNAYAGELVEYDEEADQGWLEVDVIMHVRECTETEIRIPLHVGDDRSRTWVLTRGDNGISLKHDHRHRDGKADTLHLYGGTTLNEGTAHIQRFPADQFSRTLFREEGIPDSAENTWRMEVHPGERFTYGLSRSNREFQADFDLSEPVDNPPAPWAAQPLQ